jgi:hypothetical protein
MAPASPAQDYVRPAVVETATMVNPSKVNATHRFHISSYPRAENAADGKMLSKNQTACTNRMAIYDGRQLVFHSGHGVLTVHFQ